MLCWALICEYTDPNIQSALRIREIHIDGFNQPQIQNIWEKIASALNMYRLLFLVIIP